MLTLRCTRIARERLGLPERLPEPPASTGVLGDWYVHVVHFGRTQLVLATSERTLLTVLLPARELRSNLTSRLCLALEALLHKLGVPPTHIAREIAAMEPISFARATNRRVLGSMNELAFQASAHMEHGDVDLLAVAHRLARVPMAAIGPKPGHLDFPDKVALELLAAHAP